MVVRKAWPVELIHLCSSCKLHIPLSASVLSSSRGTFYDAHYKVR
uniref:Uncharacterized protein n=1 Tax=Ascaris lumbricoides TaxID=6252 RepID=A0A0M3IQS6_ASCLU